MEGPTDIVVRADITHESGEDDEEGSTLGIKKHVKTYLNSDSEVENENETNCNNIISSNARRKSTVTSNSHIESSSDSDMDIFNGNKKRSRIKQVSRTDSDSDSNKAIDKTVKNEEQQLRMLNKKNKLKEKFNRLITSRSKDTETASMPDASHVSSENGNSDSSEQSDTGISSISSIKQIKKKIKGKMSSLQPSICDPDTSDEEAAHEIPITLKKGKMTKLTSPKPSKMSAKQAMENMQKIKSESNRMLREQQVSLPYHRPKALLLKDFMSRRKPAVSNDGKALPIKMNNDQLKQYALQLEQRQKEVIELCKSESEEEEPQDIEEASDLLYDSIHSDTMEKKIDVTKPVEVNNDLCCNPHEDSGSDINVADVNKEGNVNETIELLNEQNMKTKPSEDQASDTSMELVYNDSVESVVNTEECPITNNDAIVKFKENFEQYNSCASAQDSESISLHLDTEKTDSEMSHNNEMAGQNYITNKDEDIVEMDVVGEDPYNDFSDDDINMADIDSIIENAVLLKDDEDNVNSPTLIRDTISLNGKPRLTGAPGMVIDLDSSDPVASKKLTGVELLKERFTYFATLKTPEDIEREKKKRIKPGNQHLKLKQELEEKMAEQRSAEWAKRLEEEKKHHVELDSSDVEDDIDKIEAKLEESGELKESSESEEEQEETTQMPEKPREKNPMIADEAEESDCDQFEDIDDREKEQNQECDDNEGGEDETNEESSDDDEAYDSETETETSKPKKGRILKAFEDSDDEDTTIKLNDLNESTVAAEKIISEEMNAKIDIVKDSQDDVIQLAQRHVSSSDDLFTSQDSALTIGKNKLEDDDKDLGTQTFSIIKSGAIKQTQSEIHDDKLNAVSITQTFDDNLDMVRPGEFTQNIMGSQLPIDQASQSQPLGDDVLALCTGKFFDNQFVTPPAEDIDNGFSQDSMIGDDNYLNHSTETENTPKEDNNKEISQTEFVGEMQNVNVVNNEGNAFVDKQAAVEGSILKTILDELDDSEFDVPKPNKFFIGNKNGTEKGYENPIENNQSKKKFIIDSDDEANDTGDASAKKKKKHRRKKAEQRALQISDDEDEELEEQYEDNDESNESDLEDQENPERMIEYDSEENEVEIPISKNLKPKKKRKATDFFEQEAELTSEDEWMGSGDEDEAGLDRMEREAGDDETFHQGKLQAELGQIHLRDVLDQDKREVRIIQELLFEDGDLGDGHRQRKFRWRNADGEEDTGTATGEFGDTQEDEFESEEQWRKQRHEREVFLRQMKNQDDIEESPNVTLNRTTIIKANLSSKSMSSLLIELNTSKSECPPEQKVLEKNIGKDIPSPKKGFPIFKQNYHGSLLTRGRGALARLAALATPLAADDDAPTHGSMGPTTRRNFVFTAVTPDELKPKVIKRKADSNPSTPRLVKKMKSDEKNKYPKSSLLDHLKA